MSLLKKRKQPRPRLTLPIILYGLIDAGGMLLLAVGGLYFTAGPGAIFATFPSTTAEAVATLVLGVAVMFWAAARILREVLKQPHLMPSDADIPRHD